MLNPILISRPDAAKLLGVKRTKLFEMEAEGCIPQAVALPNARRNTHYVYAELVKWASRLRPVGKH